MIASRHVVLVVVVNLVFCLRRLLACLPQLLDSDSCLLRGCIHHALDGLARLWPYLRAYGIALNTQQDA